MNDKENSCCHGCRGVAPYYFCRNKLVDILNKGCTCHQHQEEMAQKKHRTTSYSDPTAHKAVGNVMKGTKR